jgi:leader peptidase (prepilin peptidase) / N-methyltransferase
MPFWLPALLAAPFIGSFLGVVATRLPAREDFLWSRSRCDACGHALGALEMVPLVSHLALRGECRHCRAAIGLHHPGFELAALAVAATAAPFAATGVQLWAGCVLGWTLLVLAWIDLRHMRLPDAITWPLALLGLGATALLDPAALVDHALGVVAGFGGFRLVSLAYRRLRGREGLGRGDACLLGAAGAWVGWQALPSLVLAAAVLGLLWAAAARLAGHAVGRDTALPFGPFLAAGLWLLWLAGAPGFP